MARWPLAPLLLALITSAADAKVNRGDKAPPFIAKDVTGKTVKLADFKGKQNVLLFVWSTECPVSTGELPALQKLQEAHKKKPLVMLGASVDSLGAAQLSKWARDRKLNLRLLRDPARDLADRYETAITPTFFLIDKQGIIQSRYAGGETIRKALAQDVAELLRVGKVTPRETLAQPSAYG